jgi:hypothetical protein
MGIGTVRSATELFAGVAPAQTDRVAVEMRLAQRAQEEAL